MATETTFGPDEDQAQTRACNSTSIVDPDRADKLLAFLYAACALTSVTSIISLVVVWQHWSFTLDVCMNVDCGCILYGIKTFNTFMGGDVKLCRFGAYALIPSILVGCALAFFHWYRTCMSPGLTQPRATHVNRNYNSLLRLEQCVIEVSPKQRKPCNQWIPAALVSVIIGCVSLAHSIVLTDGYYKTCDQYRRNLVKLLNSTGQEYYAILNRLSCDSILDFMDYIQPDANNWRRGEVINTGLALQVAMVSSWINFLTWLSIAVVNFLMEKRRLKSTDEKMCCCL